MKKYFSFLISLLLLVSCSNNNYEISGTITDTGLDGQYVYLFEYTNKDASLLDSARIENNKFKFSGEQPAPTLCMVTINKNGISGNKPSGFNTIPFCVGFVLENGKINIELGQEASFASGTAENNALKEVEESFRNKNAELQEIVEQLGKMREGPDRDALYTKGGQVSSETRDVIKKYVKNNTDKASGAKLLAEYSGIFTDDERMEIIDNAGELFISQPVLEPVLVSLEEIRPVAAGVKFTDFTMNDIEGNSRKLSDYVGNGKVVVIDFWASWCGPCRSTMPELIKIYNEYKDQDFDVIGISLDNKQDAWEYGVQDLEIPWTQLSDLQGWKNEAAQIYKIRSIPNLMVIGKDGTILARNLHGEALENKIKENL